MKTPYKVALIAAGVLCICVLAYSFLPDRAPTMSPAADQPPKAGPVDEHAPTGSGSTRIPAPTVAAVPAVAVEQPDRAEDSPPIAKAPVQPAGPASKPMVSVDKIKSVTSASENTEPTPEDDTVAPVAEPLVIRIVRPPAPVIEPRPKTAKDRPYTIKSGDTFAAIAQAIYGSERYTVAIAQANSDVDPKRLQPGQVIRLPDIGSDAPADTTSAKLPDGSTYYVVRARDTLSRIAKRHYNDTGLWRVIYRANRTLIGPNPDSIQPGTRLVIPAQPTAGQNAR